LKHRFRDRLSQEIEQGHIGQAHWIMLSPVNVAKHEQREFSARPFAVLTFAGRDCHARSNATAISFKVSGL